MYYLAAPVSEGNDCRVAWSRFDPNLDHLGGGSSHVMDGCSPPPPGVYIHTPPHMRR